MKIKKIALMLALAVSVNIVGSQLAFASEKTISGLNVTETNQILQLESGVINPNKMTDTERKSYNAAIDKQVEKMKNKYGNKLDTKKFREELVNILEKEDSLKNMQLNIKQSSIGTVTLMSNTWIPDICISNDYVSAAIGVVINGVLVASGVGSVTALVRKIGVAEAKKIFTKTLKSKLTAWGCGVLAVYLPKMVDYVMSVLSPEDKIAEYLDSIDDYPNDGYLDIIL